MIGTRIAIIDDDKTSLNLTAQQLRRDGHFVFTFASGLDFLKKINDVELDLVLVDALMPTMDGFEVCKKIRSEHPNKNLPVVMITSLGDLDSIQHAYDAGATDFVSKPINWKIISQRIKYMLRASSTLRQLDESESRLMMAQRIASIGYWEMDCLEKTISLSKQLREMLRINDTSIETLDPIIQKIHVDDVENFKRTIEGCVANFQPWVGELRVIVADSIIYLETQLQIVERNGHKYLSCTMQDITARKKHENKLWFLSNYDPLTNLPNKLFLEKSLGDDIEYSNRYDRQLSVMFIAINRLQQINEALGHQTGDAVVQQTSEWLSGLVRTSDTVGHDNFFISRFGADAFVMILKNINRAQDIVKIVNRINEKFKNTLQVNGHGLCVTLNMGIATYPHDGKSVESLLKNASAAMTKSRNDNDFNYKFFRNDMNAQAIDRMNLESQLRQAIDAAAFTVCYQPKVTLINNDIYGAEALARWTLPNGRVVSPMVFIPLAEELGLIKELGEEMLIKVCSEMGDFLKKNPVRMAVNLSTQQLFDRHALRRLFAVIEESGIPADRFEFEITESVLIKDLDSSVDILKEISGQGISIAIDDFGTGFSSLSYLSRLTFDILKIDKSFIWDMHLERGLVIVKAMIFLAHSLDLTVVAEGIENTQQAEMLREINCDCGQGKLYSLPMSKEDFLKLFASGKTTTTSTSTQSDKRVGRRGE